VTFAGERGSSRVSSMPAKEFMEAGKKRLTRDTVRDATRQEIEHLNSASRLLRKKRPPIVAVFWFGL